MHLLVGLIASFLPQRYRSAISVSVSAAAISGAAQLLFCLGALIHRYFTFTHARLFADTHVMVKAVEKSGEAAVMGSGLFVLMEYLIQPLTIESPTTKSSAESIIMIPRKRWLMFAARKIEQFLGASTMETL